VVFPAIKDASIKAAEVREAQGLNTKPFLEEQQAEDGTFIIPISLHGTEINQIVQDAIQSVALGSSDAEGALTDANDRVNGLFK
jgi:multiple sugar transport system substrate-binding protein